MPVLVFAEVAAAHVVDGHAAVGLGVHAAVAIPISVACALHLYGCAHDDARRELGQLAGPLDEDLRTVVWATAQRMPFGQVGKRKHSPGAQRWGSSKSNAKSTCAPAASASSVTPAATSTPLIFTSLRASVGAPAVGGAFGMIVIGISAPSSCMESDASRQSSVEQTLPLPVPPQSAGTSHGAPHDHDEPE
jgi:hypothetical protein